MRATGVSRYQAGTVFLNIGPACVRVKPGWKDEYDDEVAASDMQEGGQQQ